MPRPPIKPLSLSIFLPCYNEEANVERVARAALTVAQGLADEFEVIIVDDGSRDRTGELADALAGQLPAIRVVHNRPNRGYGGALQAGFAAAGKNWVFFTDGDGQFDMNELDRLLPLLARYDIVAGYRMNRRDPWFRKLNGWCWTTLVNFLFGLRIRDVDCAFKILPRELFDKITLHSNGALISTELLVRARNAGYSITQVGVTHYPRVAGNPTGAKLRVILRAFRELFALYRRIKHEHPQQNRHGGFAHAPTTKDASRTA
ncbi:MAG: glycosyltransferase [Phycisphaerae bacterium]